MAPIKRKSKLSDEELEKILKELSSGSPSSGSSSPIGSSYSSNSSSNSPIKTSSGGGCFIATAAYGSALEENVIILKSFRDAYLQKFSIGRMIIQSYYKISPPIARNIAHRSLLRKLVRIMLSPLVYFVKKLII